MRHAHLITAVALAAAVTSVSIAARPFLRSPAAEPGDPAAAQVAPRDPDATLLLLELHGPASVEADSAARYTLVARYSDGTTAEVTDRAEWSVDSPFAVIDRGALATGAAPASHAFTVTAWFTDGLSLKAARQVSVSGGEGAPPFNAPSPAAGVAARARAAAGRGS